MNIKPTREFPIPFVETPQNPIILPNHNYNFHLEIPIERLIDFHEHRRLSLYVYKGTVCSTCGIDCNRLIYGLDCRGNMHLDLYDQDLTRMMTIGHIVPKSKGGKMNLENIRPLCDVCNYAEGSSLEPLCQDQEMFDKHLKGQTVRRRSGNPFVNGKMKAVIEKAFLSEDDGWKFGFLDGAGTYPIDKVLLTKP